MPQNKKQHFVPKFYLRRFSKNGKSINIWNIRRQKKILDANLNNQCCRSYFYGRNLVIEETLSQVEGHAAQVFRSLEETAALPSSGSPEHQVVVLYILMQHARTSRMADELNEMTDNIAKHLVKDSTRLEGIEFSDIQIGLEEPALVALSIATACYPLLFDLAHCVLVNTSGREFVTSDNPVIFYNQLMSFRNIGSNTGLATKGLQVFLPIGPHQMILLYDADVYSVKSEKGQTVYVNRRAEVEQLNTLQLCAASENIYFQDGSTDPSVLHERGKGFRSEAISDFEVAHVEHLENGESKEILRSSRVDIKTNLSLNFLSIKYSAKRWRQKFRRMKFQPISVLRNERLMEAFELFQVEVKKGKYTPGQFFGFLQDSVWRNVL